MYRRVMVLVFLFAVPCKAFCQDFDWWAHVVNWDRVTHWSRYMITQPAYQGPNALPVPRIGNGSIDSTCSLSATASFHFSNGDNTQNLSLYSNYCLVKDVISFDIAWIPYERYSMSKAIKERRHVFSHFYYDESATGEVQLNTNIQLLKKWRKDIQLALRIGYRLPCGSGFGNARYTDGPGYSFDLSWGKPVGHSPMKWTGMLGFYSWQIISDKHRQDDALLFGTGFEWNKKAWRLQTYIAGYLGYLQNSGDKPVVVRTSLEKKMKRNSLLFGLQQGLHDFKYSSVELGMKYAFK